MASRTLLLFLLVALVAVTPVPSAGAVHDGLPEILWLRPDPDQGRSHNFTTYPPEADATGAALDLLGAGTSSEAFFILDWTPADWSVEPDIAVGLDAWLEGLDRALPTRDSANVLESPGDLIIAATLQHGTEGVFARGNTTVETDPVSPQDAPRKVEIRLEVERPVLFESDPDTGASMRLTVTVHGFTRGDEPLKLHVGSPATPSRLSIESFPVDALRAWEDAERATAACHATILEGGTCQTSEEPAPDTRNTPAAGGGAVGSVAILVAAVVLRYRGRR